MAGPVVIDPPGGAGARSGLGILAGAVLAVVVAVFMVWSFMADFRSASRVTQLSWERSLGIERIVVRSGSGWDRPSDAYDLRDERRVRTYETVTICYGSETRYDTERYVSGSESYTCGQESLGNGYFRERTCTRSVWSTRRGSRTVQVPITERHPVYETWYDYKVDRWTEIRRERSGGADDEPLWPDISLSPANGRAPGRRAIVTASFPKTGKPPARPHCLMNG